MRIITRHFERVSQSSFYQDHCFYCFPMLGWFISSAMLSAYNKYVFGANGAVAFSCPLFLTSIHFLCQWIVSDRLCATFPETTGLPRIQMLSWQEFWAISIPCGVVTAADVGLSNRSMVSISLSFYTMVKASTPVFVLFWAWLFKIERITWALMGVIAVIAAGEFLTVFGETHFVMAGFVQCLVASMLSGARWTLVQLKLQTLEPPLKTSLATMRVLAPSMFVSLLLVALAIETPWRYLDVNEAPFVLGLGALGGCFAIVMTLCEFMLIMQASAIVLMIGGVVKELLNIAIGVAFFHDELNVINTLGFCIVFGGVVLYKFTFHGPAGSSGAGDTAQPPLPVVDHYGPVAASDSPSVGSRVGSIVVGGSGSSTNHLVIHAKSSNEDIMHDDEEDVDDCMNGDNSGLGVVVASKQLASSNSKSTNKKSINKNDKGEYKQVLRRRGDHTHDTSGGEGDGIFKTSDATGDNSNVDSQLQGELA